MSGIMRISGIMRQAMLGKLPRDLQWIAPVILPVIGRMVAANGWENVRGFIYAYAGNDRSWDRRLTRHMTPLERANWRAFFSCRWRIEQLEEVRHLQVEGTELRVMLVQRLVSEAITILLGGLY